MVRYLSGLKQTIRDKIGVHVVFSVQEARNLAMKAEVLILEQTRCINYRRYGGVDNKAPSDKGKTSLAVFETVEIVNAGVGKRKSVEVEGGRVILLCLPKTVPLMQGLAVLSAIDVEVDMDACHILFRRPWQYDVDAKHSSRSNLYQLEKGGIKYTLVPFIRKNQPKALQAEGKNFLTFVYDPSSLMGECKETRELHLMVVKGEVESRDLVGAQILMEV